MGLGQSLPLTVGDSVVSPGNPSIISDPITVDYDAFIDELAAVLKYPVPPPMEPLVKKVIVTEKDTADEFEVKVLLDAVKLQALGAANKDDPSMDRIQVHVNVKLDRKNRFGSSENYKAYWAGEEPQLLVHTRIDFTENPFRLDYFWTTPEGERIANEMTRGMLQPVVNQIFDLLVDRQVVLKLNDDKKTAACDPIDDCITTYEPLFDALIYSMKNTPTIQVQDISETQFKSTTPGENAPYSIATFDKDQGSIKIDTFQLEDDKKLMTVVYSFSKDPLIIEVWSEVEGEKVTGRSILRVLQNYIDAAVEKATGDLGLF